MLDALLRLGADRPVTVVIDELPYLVTGNPALPSVIQATFGPRREERVGARTRLLLCGSAMSFMGGFLSGTVLAAVADGNSTRGIAAYLERKATDISHHLSVLEDAGLLTREVDAFRPGRSVYRISEPLITFYYAIMRPEWSRLERRGLAADLYGRS